MYLFLDNTAPEGLAFFISDDGRSSREYRKPVGGDGGLQKALLEILEIEKKNLSDLSGIAIRTGEGRFTATRVAAVFANTLVYALHLPVCAVHGSDPAVAFQCLLSAPQDKYILAEYSGLPRLGNRN